MNEFFAKKLGEVWAFSQIGIECVDRAGDAFIEALGQDGSAQFTESLKSLASDVEKSATDTTEAKMAKTSDKLRGMMEAYIGDEWDNPTEILEWLSFMLGSASAHWSLVLGAAEATENPELVISATEAIDDYDHFLEIVKDKLKTIGEQRATE